MIRRFLVKTKDGIEYEFVSLPDMTMKEIIGLFGDATFEEIGKEKVKISKN